MSNGTVVVPSTECNILPPSVPPAAPWPTAPTKLWGGYPPQNPTSAWADFAPPPTGCVYGLDGSTRSWVPVVTRWEVMCMLQETGQGTVTEAPATGLNYVRNGLNQTWIDVQSLTFDGGVY